MPEESSKALRCCDIVRSFGGVFSCCGKKARHEYEGKWYCKTHHPPAKEGRERKRQERSNADLERERVHRLQLDVAQAIFEYACLNFPHIVHRIARKVASPGPGYIEPTGGLGVLEVVQGWIEDARAMADHRMEIEEYRERSEVSNGK